MRYRKQYVDVDVSMNSVGTMCPRALHWVDGSTYEITRVKYITPAPSLKAGGQGDRYTVIVEGQERYLFFERPTIADNPALIGRWFVEAPEA